MTGPARDWVHRIAAHQYLDAGWLPVGWVIINGTKAAVSMKGRHYDGYSISHAEIDRWPWRWQVGLAMCEASGHWALDFDCGQQRAEEFFAENVVTPTATQLTGRGFHLVYQGTGGAEWPRDGVWSADWLDVQVRSNGFIAAAPSIHPNGRQYRWAGDRQRAEPGSLLLGLRPERQARHLGRGSPSRPGGPDGDLEFYARCGIPAGWQDTELYRLACKHVRKMSEVELFGWLWKAACASVQNLHNPWREQDVMAKIRNAAEFVSQSDKAAMKMHDAWLAAMGGAR